MPRVPLEIATGFYESESLPLNAQRCINWIPVIPQPQGESLNPRALFGRPGLKTFGTLTGSNRGSIRANKVPYFVNGNALFSTDSAGNETNHGFIEGSGRVSMATNTTIDGVTKIAIVVPGGKGYVFVSPANTLTEISDSDFQPSDTVVFKDGFYVFTASSGLTFFNSALNDPLTIDALDFGTAEIKPDLIVAGHVNHNELFILGEDTIELFQNVGGAGFPFQRIPGANIQKGLHAKFGVVEFDNSFVFIGGGENECSAIWRASGSSSANKISTSAIDHAIQEFNEDEISNASAMTYARNGNFFAIFTFESSRIPSKTFAYNATASALAQRSIWFELQTGTTDNRWRVQSIVKAFGKLLCGDQTSGIIGELDDDTFEDYGEVIFHQKSSRPFSNFGTSIFADGVELTLESGVGLTTGQGSDPVVRMGFSNDGGRTFSSEFSRRFGKIGEYGRRVVWRRQGKIPVQRVLRFTMTDPVRSNLLQLSVNAESGVEDA